MRIVLLAFLIMCVSSAAHAQAPAPKTSFSLIAGGAQTFDDESSLGRGWLVGVAIDRVLAGSTRVEGSLEFVTHDRTQGFFLAEGHTLIGGVSLVQRFGHGRIQPYGFTGLTAGHHSGSTTFGDLHTEASSTDWGWRAGVGLTFRAGSRYEISPELRMNGFFIDSDSHPATLPSIGVRFGVPF